MTTETEALQEPEDRAKDQARAQLSSIREMLAALNVDYDRLEELREELADLQSDVFDAVDTMDSLEFASMLVSLDEECPALIEAEDALYDWGKDNHDELDELKSAAGDCENEEDARERIQGDPLSVQVRSDWYSPGAEPAHSAAEFEILLCTGGPAVRIMGELNRHNEPDRAWIEYQDWGTPWTHYYEPGTSDSLVEYAQQFYFGD